MAIPAFIKKKIDASKDSSSSDSSSSGDSSSADSSSVDSSDAASKPGKGGKKPNPLLAWAKSRS